MASRPFRAFIEAPGNKWARDPKLPGMDLKDFGALKDSEVGDRLFTVDVAKCFEIAKASGFRGYYSMEWEGAGEPHAGTHKLIDLSLKYLG